MSVNGRMEKLAARCEAVGWKVEESDTSYKVTNLAGHPPASFSKKDAGRNHSTGLAVLRRLGIEEAEEKARVSQEAERAKRLAQDRDRNAKLFLEPDAAPATTAATKSAKPASQASSRPAGMYTETVTITPEMATEYLKREPAFLDDGTRLEQRPLGGDHALWLAGIIERDEWMLTPEGLTLAPCGGVLDGQHRLTAITLADKPVQMRVTYDCPPSVFAALNTGKKRTAADVLTISGAKDAFRLSSVLKLLWCWEQWRADLDGPYASWLNWNRMRPTSQQLLILQKDYPDVHDYAKAGVSMLSQAKGVPSAGGAFLYLAHREIARAVTGDLADEWLGRLEQFTADVQSGEMIGRGHPAYTLRNWMIGGGGPTTAGRREYHLLALLKAWRAYATNKEVFLIKFAPEERMILPFSPKAGQ